ncbi:hypothetical protein N7474_007150 [Penicillium riverlandense]|uniref:uncharacterized protein n=1 Tax=Penicillium riverlandense TaxID=1903569 RepID=UPI002547463A|nr:uncharacterized protein N7474_007150 [Penicillium riverlandense]KAJ5815373.1 hypothetical protein N7474_007150 [Penicillium riverlandense]
MLSMRSLLQAMRPAHTVFTRHTTRMPSRLISTQLFAPSRSQIPTLYQRNLTPSITLRQNSTTTPSKPLTDRPETQDQEGEKNNEDRRKEEEAYRIVFTCKPCSHRSSHRMSKQGYHRGTVLIQCPSCDSRHVISDHLGIFFDQSTTLEDLLQQRGQVVTRGHTDGNMEFWEDGTVKRVDEEGIPQPLESEQETPSEEPKSS